MKQAEKPNPVMERIESGKVELLRCKTREEIEAVLARMQDDVSIPMTEPDKYGLLIQAMVMDNFDGLDKAGKVQFEEGTWERFIELWLCAVGGRI